MAIRNMFLFAHNLSKWWQTDYLYHNIQETGPTYESHEIAGLAYQWISRFGVKYSKGSVLSLLSEDIETIFEEIVHILIINDALFVIRCCETEMNDEHLAAFKVSDAPTESHFCLATDEISCLLVTFSSNGAIFVANVDI